MWPTEDFSGLDQAGLALKKVTDEELPKTALLLRCYSPTVFILEFGNSQAETPSAPMYFVSFLFSHITLHTEMSATFSFAS